jgi:hypothetical protein
MTMIEGRLREIALLWYQISEIRCVNNFAEFRFESKKASVYMKQYSHTFGPICPFYFFMAMHVALMKEFNVHPLMATWNYDTKKY